MKYAEPHPFADPDAAARRLVEIASTIELVQNGRIYVECPVLASNGDDFSLRLTAVVRATFARLSQFGYELQGPLP